MKQTRGRPRRIEADVLEEIRALEQTISARSVQQRRDVQRLSRLRRHIGINAPVVDRARQLDPAEVQRAIRDVDGNMSAAARLLSDRLGEPVARSTLRDHLLRLDRLTHRR